MRINVSDYSHVVVLTGAGISVASGLQPFRGPGGLWEEQPDSAPLTAQSIASDPSRVWSFFRDLRTQIRDAKPNPAHLALAQVQAVFSGASFTLVTQNVDGLHQAAGSTDVVELHGSLANNLCASCSHVAAANLDAVSAPACPACGSLMRPAVVLFDEPVPVDAEWKVKRALRECTLFIAIGTSGTVSPASNFVRSAEYAGARTILVNLEPMKIPNPAFHEQHLGPAEKVLPEFFGL